MSFDEGDFLPISALQHFMFCQRRFALIHMERLWAGNRFTAEGDQLHLRVDDPKASENRSAVKVVRSLGLCSAKLGLVGKADVVEFHRSANSAGSGCEINVIEYKRGKSKPMLDLPFKVQLCAQALCIEEMLGYPVKSAFLYFGLERRRVEVALDHSLRDMTIVAIEGMHLLISSRSTPLPSYKPRKCKSCSLIDLCLPTAPRPRFSASRYIASLLSDDDA